MAKRKYVKENNLVKAINTDSLELQKPLVNEYYDINVHNSNMDKIDLGYKQNKNDISNINYELSKTENTKYTTENGVKEFECKNGYVDNVVIEGKTKILNSSNIECEAGADGAKLVSVGQGDKIEVLSNNKNLCDTQEIKLNRSLSTSGIESEHLGRAISGYCSVQPNTYYIMSGNGTGEWYYIEYDINKKLIGNRMSTSSGEFITSPNTKYVRFFRLKISDNALTNISEIQMQLEEGTVATEYTPHKSDKKQILTTLRSLPNGVKDTIEKRGNKYYKIKRCGEYTITGNEGITMTSSTTLNVFNIPYALNSTKSLYLLCDKYQMLTSSGTKQGILYDYSNNRFRVTDDNFTSVDNFVTELKSNPVTVVYELETPVIEELPNFNPQTFSDKTTLLLNSGVVQGECNFEVTNSLGSEIEVLKDKVSDLDNNTIYSEDIQLFNGWEKDVMISKVTRQGNLVHLCLSIKNGTADIDTLIGRISPIFVPKEHSLFSGIVCNSAYEQNIASIIIGTNGNIRINDLKNLNTRLLINATWEVE